MFVKILIAVLIVIAAIYVILFIRSIPRRINEASMRKYGKQREKYIYSLLCNCVGKRNVFNNIFLPVPTKEGVFDTEVDTLCITRAGIAVIETKGSKGLIESPEKGKWCQRHGAKTMYFENPYDQNKTHVKALERVLDSHRLSKVHLYNLVVFADTGVQFTQSHPWLLRADKLCAHISELEKNSYLTDRDIAKLRKILKGYKRPHNKTFSEKFRKRRFI